MNPLGRGLQRGEGDGRFLLLLPVEGFEEVGESLRKVLFNKGGNFGPWRGCGGRRRGPKGGPHFGRDVDVVPIQDARNGDADDDEEEEAGFEQDFRGRLEFFPRGDQRSAS
jgi:hypothetical protein